MKTIILSLGGSLIVPDQVDVNFLKNFKKLVEKYVKRNFRFVIICGGGSIARKYQQAFNSFFIFLLTHINFLFLLIVFQQLLSIF